MCFIVRIYHQNTVQRYILLCTKSSFVDSILFLFQPLFSSHRHINIGYLIFLKIYVIMQVIGHSAQLEFQLT